MVVGGERFRGEHYFFPPLSESEGVGEGVNSPTATDRSKIRTWVEDKRKRCGGSCGTGRQNNERVRARCWYAAYGRP